MTDHDHDHAKHDHQHGGHGHANDQGLSGVIGYLGFAPQMWRSSINEAVVALVDPQPGELVVDIGAGMGPGTVAVARRGAKVVAVEPTPFLRSILSTRRLFNRSRSLITASAGSAESLPTDDLTADAVLAVNTMHHWVDVEQGVIEIARVLKPGGRVLLVDEDFADQEHPDFEKFGQRFGADEEGHHHGFTMVNAEDMGELFHAVGLVEIEAAKQKIDGRPAIAVRAWIGK